MAPAPFRRAGRRVLAVAVAVVTITTACGHRDEGAASTAGVAPADPAVVRTAQGPVRGVVADGHRFFGGLPYAAPPVGALRWQPPASPPTWRDTRDATRLGPRCIQDTGDLEMGRLTDEDCLTLNVWTPRAASPEAKKAVMVWFHGGSFINGSSGIYDSRWLTTRGDVVVVTVNYRLGTLGFLAHPGLGPAGAVGNYGLADQQAALRWVHDNVAAFGGDPDRVTIAGESAGGMSVCDHLAAPGSQGLFARAIIQSGPCQAQVALPDAERISLDYARDAGCPDPATAAACLRALPADKLRDPVRYYWIGEDALSGPATGSTVLPQDPVAAMAAGSAADVPVLIGSNRDEFTLFVALQHLQGKPMGPQDYGRLVAETFGAAAPAVEARYPLDAYGGSAQLAYSAAVTDADFACVDQRMATDLGKAAPVYAYEFVDQAAPAPEPLRTVPFPIGASHSLELRYLFDTGGAPPLDGPQQALSDHMIAYWAAFVRDGAPDVDGLPEWPKAGDDARRRLSLGPDRIAVIDDFARVHDCDFWADLGR